MTDPLLVAAVMLADDVEGMAAADIVEIATIEAELDALAVRLGCSRVELETMLEEGV
jgi:hypothetical protein